MLFLRKYIGFCVSVCVCMCVFHCFISVIVTLIEYELKRRWDMVRTLTSMIKVIHFPAERFCLFLLTIFFFRFRLGSTQLASIYLTHLFLTRIPFILSILLLQFEMNAFIKRHLQWKRRKPISTADCFFFWL